MRGGTLLSFLFPFLEVLVFHFIIPPNQELGFLACFFAIAVDKFGYTSTMQFLLLCVVFFILFIIRRCLLLDSLGHVLDWLGTFALKAQKLLVIFLVLLRTKYYYINLGLLVGVAMQVYEYP